MKQLIVRADDYGISEAVSMGILSAFDNGIVTSIGMMVNMPFAYQAAQLMEDRADVCLGLHVNLIVGRPCADSGDIPGLVRQDGSFVGSAVRRKQIGEGCDPFVYEEVYQEVQMQILRFQEMTGRLPDYLDSHSVSSPVTDRAITEAALSRGIRRVAIRSNVKAPWKRVEQGISHYEYYKSGLPLHQYFDDRYLCLPDDLPGLFVAHPGFMDLDVMELSSMTFDRLKDHRMLTDVRVKQWIDRKGIKLIRYSDVEINA